MIYRKYANFHALADLRTGSAANPLGESIGAVVRIGTATNDHHPPGEDGHPDRPSEEANVNQPPP